MFPREQPPELEILDRFLEPSEVLGEVLLDLLALSRPFDERRDLVGELVEPRAAPQFVVERGPSARQGLPIAPGGPDARVRQLLVEFGNLLTQPVGVKETPG